MVDLRPFHAGIEKARQSSSSVPYSDPREGFLSELSAAGFERPKAVTIGQLMRIDAPGDKPGKRSGWAIYNEIIDNTNEGRVIGVGTYGSWRSDPEKVTWVSKNLHTMSTAERLNYHAQIEAVQVQRAEELKKLQNEAAQTCFNIWNNAKAADPDHLYLVRKQIPAYDGVRQSGDNIIIPVLYDKKIASLQFITPEGEKRFKRNGRTKGCYFKIDGADDVVYVAEGYATAASVHMSAGNTVYIAFNANNLYEIASLAKTENPESRIIIAGDDDVFTNNNPGRTKANQCAEALGLEAAFPAFKDLETRPVDWNDLHVLEGIEAVRSQLAAKPKIYKKKAVKTHSGSSEVIFNPPAILGELTSYYHATSGNKQPAFAVQTAIAILSVLCARTFETNLSNRASLFMMNIGKSGTGKEHAKKMVERVLKALGENHLIGGDGYTSGSAVISALQDKPRHITIIDEFSKYLQAAQNKYSNGQLADANTQLMQAIGRLDGTMRPKAYSTATLTKERRKELVNKEVVNPAITLLSMSTPDDLFQNMDISAIKDGFLNRFIICISEAERALREHKEWVDLPESIIKWHDVIKERRGTSIEDGLQEPTVIKINFTIDALEMQRQFQQFCIDKANELEKYSMAELPGRSNEMAMRLSLIVALSRDPHTEIITAEDMAWSIEWVKYHMLNLVEKLKMTISSSEFEGWKKECLAAFRAAGENGVSVKEMHKTQPFAKYRKKDRQEIVESLIEAELITLGTRKTGKKGRETMAYFAIED